MDLVGFPKAMAKREWPGLQKAVLEVAALGLTAWRISA